MRTPEPFAVDVRFDDVRKHAEVTLGEIDEPEKQGARSVEDVRAAIKLALANGPVMKTATGKGRAEAGQLRVAAPRPGPRRTGSVEPGRRADGSAYFRARLRLADGSRVRIDVPEKYAVAAGGMSGRERAELYAEAEQEREDETGTLLATKTKRSAKATERHEATHGETCEKYFRRFIKHIAATGWVRRTRDLESSWDTWLAPKLGSCLLPAPGASHGSKWRTPATRSTTSRQAMRDRKVSPSAAAVPGVMW